VKRRLPAVLLASVVLFGGTTWCEWSGHRWWYSLRRAAPSPEVVDAVKAAERQRLARVVLLTLDGPVTEDVLSPALMPRLHAAVAKEGVWLEARAASVTTLSLPSYQALSVGRLTACRTNDCGRVTEETVGEFLVRALKVPREQVALFASWSRTSLAVASREDVMFLDAPEEGGKADGRPWRNARLDVETFARARAHWAEVHPRFLHLSLLDTDEWAHLDDRPAYERALRASDEMLGEVLGWLDALPEAERAMTTLLVTSDHSRGRSDWREHQTFDLGSGSLFFAAVGPSVNAALPREVVDQRDVRWTIERLFGFCTEGRRGGQPIDAVVQGLPCTR
jgi:hypothetical protein